MAIASFALLTGCLCAAPAPPDPAAVRSAIDLGLEALELPRGEDVLRQYIHHLVDHALGPEQQAEIVTTAADQDLSPNEKRRRIAALLRPALEDAERCDRCRAWREDVKKRTREVRLAFIFRDGREFVHHPETGEIIDLHAGSIEKAGIAYYSEAQKTFIRLEGKPLVDGVYAIDLLDSASQYNSETAAGPAILRRRDGSDEKLERLYIWGFGFRYTFDDPVTRIPRAVEPLDWSVNDGRRFYAPVRRIILAEQRLKQCPADKHLFPFDYRFCPYCKTPLTWSH
ncbi:MAG: hypothetical protein JXP34_19045 [Planctomycetes bacterium]|nr:hypothetical protein [Planctomycetota bacterium]